MGFNQKLKPRHVPECKIGENDPSYKNLQITPQEANLHATMEVTYRNGLPKRSRKSRITVANKIMLRNSSVAMPL